MQQKDISITPNPDCKTCDGSGLMKADLVPAPFEPGMIQLPEENCHCVVDQLPDDDHDWNIFFKFPEPEPKALLHTDSVWCQCPECGEAKLDPKVSTLPADLENTNVEYHEHAKPEKPEPRYTWTYGAGEGRTIFINDNSLPGPYRGIASLTCAKIGKESAERLAHAWCRALDLLATLQGVLPTIKEEAERRASVAHMSKVDDPYWSEMREAANAIGHEIALAQGREPETCRRTYPGACEHGFKYTPCPECAKPAEPQAEPETCPHGFVLDFEHCPDCEPVKTLDDYDYAADDRNFDSARERSMKR